MRNDEIATAVLAILDRYVKDNGTTIGVEDGNAAAAVAATLYAVVIDRLRADAERRLIAERYQQFPEAYAAPVHLELSALMATDSELMVQLQQMLKQYADTAVSHQSGTQINVTGSGTVVQGSHNVVVGPAARTSIRGSQNKKNDAPDQEERPVFPQAKQLRLQIAYLFNADEVETLCWDLQLPYGELGGSTHSVKVRQLIDYCWRNGRLPDLITYCRQHRAHEPWDYEIE